ncbi:hypothetical protein GCM10011415_09550 [Salipiger pallidus]|uniref:Uncharacterized protein n=1 Tax=Salipiger pallidus TaxID=1775170 RepID=A0A8J2ZHH5_9RHOB|nr:hypothetical protein GCM10011415_09550 [Salipiger pallidus]
MPTWARGAKWPPAPVARQPQTAEAIPYYSACGFAAQDGADRVIGIDASGVPKQSRAQGFGIVDNAADLMGLVVRFVTTRSS